MKSSIFTGMILLWFNLLVGQQVVINEFSASNGKAILDFEGDSPDWIELHNTTNTPVDLLDWTIDDDDQGGWRFPDVAIGPHSYLLVFASGKDGVFNGELHSDFRINAAGEDLILKNSGGQEMDRIMGVQLCRDYSYGRFPDGGPDFYIMDSTTPGDPNAAASIASVDLTLTFSHPAGFYNTGFDLNITCAEPDAEIRYTLDGAEPTPASTLYQGGIPIAGQVIDHGISYIPTSDGWKQPDGGVFHGMVVRAKAYFNGGTNCRSVTNSYFVDPNIFSKYELPIASISLDPDDLFNDTTGIYVKGNDENYFKRGRAWEKPAHFEYFETKSSRNLQQNIGIRVHGRGSRSGPQKSLRIYAREEYGKSALEFPFFDQTPVNTFKRLILRSPMTDWWDLAFKDALAQNLVREMNLESQAARPVIVFINGAYWGIHFLYERQDEHYLDNYYDADEDKTHILEENSKVVHGNAASYQQMLRYIEQNDLQDSEHYDFISKRMDVANYIDYLVAQFYFSNVDWPHTNTKYWKADGVSDRWRWFFFDQDAAFWRLGHNMIAEYHPVGSAQNDYPAWSTFLTEQLLRNASFQTELKLAFVHHLKATFSPVRVIHQIDEFEKLLNDEMPEYIRRWNYPETEKKWLKSIESAKQFAVHRPTIVMQDVFELLGSPFVIAPNPASSVVNVRFKSSTTGAVGYTLCNLYGKALLRGWHQTQMGYNSFSIDVSNLPSGIYLVQMSWNGVLFTEKAMVHQ